MTDTIPNIKGTLQDSALAGGTGVTALTRVFLATEGTLPHSPPGPSADGSEEREQAAGFEVHSKNHHHQTQEKTEDKRYQWWCEVCSLVTTPR